MLRRLGLNQNLNSKCFAYYLIFVHYKHGGVDTMNFHPAELLEGHYGQLGNSTRSFMPLNKKSDSEVFSVETEKQDNLSYTTKKHYCKRMDYFCHHVMERKDVQRLISFLFLLEMNNELYSSIFYSDEIEIYRYIYLYISKMIYLKHLYNITSFLPQCVGGQGCFQALKKRKLRWLTVAVCQQLNVFIYLCHFWCDFFCQYLIPCSVISVP